MCLSLAVFFEHICVHSAVTRVQSCILCSLSACWPASVSIVRDWPCQIMHLISNLESCVCMQMIRHSTVIPIVLIVDMVALLFYNLAGMCVTGAQHPSHPSYIDDSIATCIVMNLSHYACILRLRLKMTVVCLPQRSFTAKFFMRQGTKARSIYQFGCTIHRVVLYSMAPLLATVCHIVLRCMFVICWSFVHALSGVLW